MYFLEHLGYNDRSFEGNPDGKEATGPRLRQCTAGGTRNGLGGVTLARQHQMLGNEMKVRLVETKISHNYEALGNIKHSIAICLLFAAQI